MNNSHLKHAKEFNSASEQVGQLQGNVLKYKELIDENNTITNIISNGFFNINKEGKDKSESEIKEMKELTKEDILNRKKNITDTRKRYTNIQNNIIKDKSIIPIIKELLLKTIEQGLQKLKVIELAIPIEAKKSCYTIQTGNYGISLKKEKLILKKLGYANDKIIRNTEKIEEIQTSIYGPKISDVPEEINEIYNIIDSLYKINGEKLTPQENEKMMDFLEKIKIEGTNTTREKEAEKKDKTGNTGQLSMTVIKNISDYIIQNFYNTPDWKAEIKTGQNNLGASFTKQELKLPGGNNQLSEDKLLTIIEHETGGHIVRGAKTKKRLGFMGKNYENIEEGIATLNEYLIHHDDIETLTIKPEISHIATLIGELYDFEGTFTILKSYYKLIGKSDNVANKLALTRTKRVKSYYDWDRPGANRKDVIYYRGLKKLKEHLEKLPPEERANFYNDAYFSTLSFEDVCLVSTMKKEMEINDDTTDIPYPLAKLIARKQSYKNPKTETNKGAFKNKEEIQERLIGNDFRFQKIAPLTMEKKRQVINIIQYKEESKEYENLKKDLETINNIIRRGGETNQYNESLFISEITKKLFIKRKNMVEKEIVDQNTLKTGPKKRGTFSIIEILQKVGDEIEGILTRKLK